MGDLAVDNDGNMIVSDSMTRDQLEEVAMMLGFNIPVGTSDATLAKLLLMMEGTAKLQAPKAKPKGNADVVKYLEERPGLYINLKELTRECGATYADMEAIMKKHPGRFSRAKKERSILYQLKS